jgi:hypothetical protein
LFFELLNLLFLVIGIGDLIYGAITVVRAVAVAACATLLAIIAIII